MLEHRSAGTLDRVFDKLIDVAIQFLDLFRPWQVVEQYERGIVLRFGKFNREIGPGFHPIIPFNAEVVWTDNVVPTTTTLDAQSLTTLDDVSLVATGVITWEIVDIQKFLLEVEGRETVLQGSAYGCISKTVESVNWSDIEGGSDLAHEIEKDIRRRAKKFGVHVSEFEFKDFARARPYRIISNTPIYE